MMTLPHEFLSIPIAHRGLHGPGVPENSLAAARNAVDAGFGIELDIQPALDGTPMVFHDYDLARLTGAPGVIGDTDANVLSARRLLGSDEPIPTLDRFLNLVSGRAPLLIEIKDQDMSLGPDIGDLHVRVAEALKGYDGPVAVMSFNPHVVAAFHALAPAIPVGLTTCGFDEADWPGLPEETRSHLAGINDFDQSGACFISHDKRDLTNSRVDALKSQGVPILCWTIRSLAEATLACRIADNITFEGYVPEI